jgi:hypothetical protein
MMILATAGNQTLTAKLLAARQLNRRCYVMETLDYFVLILVVIAYLGWFLARETDTESPDAHSRM